MAKSKNTTSKKPTEAKKRSESTKKTISSKPSVYVSTPRKPSVDVPIVKQKLELQKPARPSVYVTKPVSPKKQGKTNSPMVKKKTDSKSAKHPLSSKEKVTAKTSGPAVKPGIPKKIDTAIPHGKPKSPILPKGHDLPKPSAQPESPKYKDLSKLLDSLRNSELLKEYSTPPPPVVEKKPIILKKPDPPKSADPTKMTAAPFVLIVDDNDVQLFLMKKIVEEIGYECITSNSPETAVRIITEKMPAIVFCDVNFGIGNPSGLDVFVTIRKKNISVPFIIVSAFLQQEFIDKAMKLGVTDYLLKPVDQDAVIDALKKYVSP